MPEQGGTHQLPGDACDHGKHAQGLLDNVGKECKDAQVIMLDPAKCLEVWRQQTSCHELCLDVAL